MRAPPPESTNLSLRSPLRPQLSVFTAFWAYGCLWPWLSWVCSYCGLNIFVGTCERHRQNLQTCLSEALCVHSCLFSPLSVHMAVWNRALNHTRLEPPLTTELFASQWEVWHKGPGEALLGTNCSREPQRLCKTPDCQEGHNESPRCLGPKGAQ